MSEAFNARVNELMAMHKKELAERVAQLEQFEPKAALHDAQAAAEFEAVAAELRPDEYLPASA